MKTGEIRWTLWEAEIDGKRSTRFLSVVIPHQSILIFTCWNVWTTISESYVMMRATLTQPIDLQISQEVTVPEITKRQVWNALNKLKRRASGPHNISFWIWKDYAELLTLVITQFWNLSPSTHSWPRTLERAGRPSTPYGRSISPKRILTTKASTSSPWLQEHPKKLCTTPM